MTAEQTEQASVASWEAAAYVQFGVPDVPFSAIRFPLVEDPKAAAEITDRALKMAVYLKRKYQEAFPDAPPQAQQRPAGAPPARERPRGGTQRQGGGKFASRGEKYELYEGETCDICDGPVGIYPQTGKMRSDKLVCLGKCKDDQYVHTVRWLDADGDDIPF